ncbi:hypothetical protein AAFF_G00096350 [Aldrovandia affinis]|uniref:Kelch domain-containing protein 7A n=1 Tax=Aldrovandia affinis TaxID=143900 RepID=A0AAD7RY82_9TELE|nr:hypothetical protein AAFF_G00096350 [Aldrovandia affinis]
MPVAEDLLGVRLDTQMLAKLALSVVGVLLVSWAYRFYSSRSRCVRLDGPGSSRPDRTSAHWGLDGGTSSEGSADSCEEEPLRLDEPASGETLTESCKRSSGELQNKPSPDETPSEQCKRSPGEAQNKPSLAKILPESCKLHNKPSPGEMLSEQHKSSSEEPPRGFLAHTESDAVITRGEVTLTHKSDRPVEESVPQHDTLGKNRTPAAHDHHAQRVLRLSCEEPEGRLDADLILGSSLSPPPVEDRDQGRASPSGRRSPCVLRRLEPSTGVGRQLRQDLEHSGSFSYFLSKAEVRMEGGDFLLERDGNELIEVRGRIYDYHVESSSQSLSDEGPLTPSTISKMYQGAGSYDPQGLKEPEVGAYCGGAEPICSLSPTVASPLILQDLVLPSESVLDPPAPASPDAPAPGRHGLIRKDSYMHIVENTDLQIPFLNPRAFTPMSTLSSQTPSSEDLCAGPLSSVKDPTILSGEKTVGIGLEGVGGMSIPQTPVGGGSPELDSLQGNLDLGNCLHALTLARKQGHAGLQRAALKVMSDNYLQVLQDPGLYGSLRGGDRDLIQQLRAKGRRRLVVADLDPQDWVGPECSPSRASSRLYYYDDCKDAWHPLCPLPKEVVSRGSAMCVMDNYLYIAVGCQGSRREVQPSRRVFCYNPATSIWKEISPMNEARPQCKLVGLGGYVYAIGGECLSSVERYDPRMDRWVFVAPMPNDTFAVAHRATTCNGELFVSGGTLRYTLLRYNPVTNAWRRSRIVGSKDRTAEMVAVRNFLYRFDVGPTPGVSVYRYHVAARLWYECCSKQLPHCPAFQCAVMDNVIYCVSRRATMRFLADDVSPAFIAEDLSILSAAKGILHPLILALPDAETHQTRV